MKKGKAQGLKALIFIAFIVGAVGAIAWGFSFKTFNVSQAATSNTNSGEFMVGPECPTGYKVDDKNNACIRTLQSPICAVALDSNGRCPHQIDEKKYPLQVCSTTWKFFGGCDKCPINYLYKDGKCVDCPGGVCGFIDPYIYPHPISCAEEGETIRNEFMPFNGKPTICCPGLTPVFALDPYYGRLFGLTGTCKKPAECALEGETIQNENLNSNDLANQGRPKKCCDGLQPVFPADESGNKMANAIPTCRVVKCAKDGESLPNASLGPDNPANKDKATVCCPGLVAVDTSAKVDPNTGLTVFKEGVSLVCKKPICGKEGELLKNPNLGKDDAQNNARPQGCCEGLKPSFLADEKADKSTQGSAICVVINCAKEGEYLRNPLLDKLSKNPPVCCEGLAPVFAYDKVYRGEGEVAMCLPASNNCAKENQSLRNPTIDSPDENKKPTICCDGLKPVNPNMPVAQRMCADGTTNCRGNNIFTD